MTQQLHSLAVIPKEWKFMSTEKPAHTFHRSFICHSQKLETSQVLFNGWIAKQTAAHQCHGILHSKKHNKVLMDAHNNLNVSPEKCAKWKKSISKGNVLCNSIYMLFMIWKKFSEKDNWLIVASSSGSSGGWREWMHI